MALLWSSGDDPAINRREAEIRKDRSITVANPAWRIYLDNYDLLEKVKSVDIEAMEDRLSPAVLALRQEYEYGEVPRNLKKSTNRALSAEVQGAQVDGELGIAYTREAKLLKYLGATLSLSVTHRQVQVVCGGWYTMVYVAMFRRQLLGCLNAVWKFFESFEAEASTPGTPPSLQAGAGALFGVNSTGAVGFPNGISSASDLQ